MIDPTVGPGVLSPTAPMDYRAMGREARRLFAPFPLALRASVESLIFQQLPKPIDDDFRRGWKDEDGRMSP